MPQQTSQQNNQPVHRVKVGAITAAIWANERAGRTFYSTALQRSYVDERTGNWAYTTSFELRHLADVGRAVELAQDWIREQIQATAVAADEAGVAAAGMPAADLVRYLAMHAKELEARNARLTELATKMAVAELTDEEQAELDALTAPPKERPAPPRPNPVPFDGDLPDHPAPDGTPF